MNNQIERDDNGQTWMIVSADGSYVPLEESFLVRGYFDSDFDYDTSVMDLWRSQNSQEVKDELRDEYGVEIDTMYDLDKIVTLLTAIPIDEITRFVTLRHHFGIRFSNCLESYAAKLEEHGF